MSYGKTESRTTIIRHLRNELDDVKKSCEKYEELNGAMVALENNLKSLKEEKESENQEAQLKCQELTNSIRDAESLITELKEECREGEKAAADAKTHMERLNSDLSFVEAKEAGLLEKLGNLSAFITDLQNSNNTLRDGTDVVKKELAQMKSNMTGIEKELLSVEEKISKANLAKKGLEVELLELESKEKRLALLRTDRDIERDNLTLLFDKKNNRLADLNAQYANLQEQEVSLNNERNRIRSATEDNFTKRMHEESIASEIRADLHNLESKTKHVDDEYRLEEAEYVKAADQLNDQREKNTNLTREVEKLKACLFGMEELAGRVVYLDIASYECRTAQV